MNQVPQLRDRAWLVNAYVVETKSLSQIAKELGVTTIGVHYWVKKHGIPRRTVSEGLLLQRGNGLTLEFLQREYIEKKRTMSDIALEVRCHPTGVRDSLIRFGIPLRGVKEANRLKHGKMISAEFLQLEYVEKKRSVPDIARELQCSESTVFKWMDEHKIERRSIQLSKLLAGEHPEISREVLEREYYQNKKGCSEIADMLGSTRENVRCWMRYYGMKARSMPEAVSIAASGPRNPHYYDGRFAERAGMRATAQFRNLKKAVFARDNYTCQLCGHQEPACPTRKEMLEYQHITRNMDRFFDPTNGICLCNRCHMANGDMHTPEMERKLELIAVQNELRRVTSAVPN
jgi:transposase-like protein